MSDHKSSRGHLLVLDVFNWALVSFIIAIIIFLTIRMFDRL